MHKQSNTVYRYVYDTSKIHLLIILNQLLFFWVLNLK